jgi:hypothetical protein
VSEQQSSIGKPPFAYSFLCTDTFSCDDVGHISLVWPCPLSTEEYADVCAWLDLVKRKMGRQLRDLSDPLSGPMVVREPVPAPTTDTKGGE